ncbi:MAG TPA: hypothetical protein VLT10_00540 [Verrucomicrobiae bacterium]|nr:hypothetical protein [Verrucomicrobiae bacterium]
MLVKMTEERRNFSASSTTANGFLGGVTFTSLILLLEKGDSLTLSIPYLDVRLISILIPLTAVVSFFFILATLGTIRDRTDEGSVHKRFYYLTLSYTVAGLIGLMFIIPMVIFFYTWVGAIVVGIIEIITASIMIYESKKLPKLW